MAAPNSYNARGNINSSRGQLGLCVFHNATVATINQDVLPVQTAANPFNDYYNKYIFTTSADFTFKLNAIGTNNNEVEPGYFCLIINNSIFTITITDSSSNIIFTLLPKYQVTFIAALSPDTWNIADIAYTDNNLPTITINTITTLNATPTTIVTISTDTDTGYNINNYIVCYGPVSADTAAINYNISAKNTAGTVTIVDSILSVNGRTNDNISANAIVSGTNILIRVVGLAITTINWKCQSTILSQS